jgi:hypothetical protein
MRQPGDADVARLVAELQQEHSFSLGLGDGRSLTAYMEGEDAVLALEIARDARPAADAVTLLKRRWREPMRYAPVLIGSGADGTLYALVRVARQQLVPSTVHNVLRTLHELDSR